MLLFQFEQVAGDPFVNRGYAKVNAKEMVPSSILLANALSL